jgi:hypothetical protein
MFLTLQVASIVLVAVAMALQHVSILAGVGAKINPDEFWRASP